MVRMATANRINAAPLRLNALHGSPRMRMPFVCVCMCHRCELKFCVQNYEFPST